MSRIGKVPVAIPEGVSASLDGQSISVKGPKGELAAVMVDDVLLKMEDGSIHISPRNDSKRARSMWGLSRALIANLVDGVTTGFTKELQINGVGYRAEVQGKNLKLHLGFSHDVLFPIPEGVDVKCPSPTGVVITGIDKQKVGQVAAEIRRYRPPEPYKGKGIKYVDEYIYRKEGKKK